MSEKYRVRNWPEYNKALTNRGSITFWFNESVIATWYAEFKCKSGRPFTYSDIAIESCALLRLWFNKPLRATEGLVRSLLGLLKVELAVPSYRQISRRQKKLPIKLKHSVKGPIHVVIDASGLKVFGEGEWQVRQHRYSKRRTWRKLHIGVAVKTQEIVMMELTDNHVGENKLLSPLLSQYKDDLLKVGGDKAYDGYECHEEVRKRGATSAILIQRKSKIRKRKKKDEPTLARDDIVRRMREIGRTGWKEEVDYYKRSLVETAFFRYKKLFGDKLHGRRLENQKIEALLCCNMLNRFTQRGMPDSVPI